MPSACGCPQTHEATKPKGKGLAPAGRLGCVPLGPLLDLRCRMPAESHPHSITSAFNIMCEATASMLASLEKGKGRERLGLW